MRTVRPGMKRELLKARYDVDAFEEDEWHSVSGAKTSAIISKFISNCCSFPHRLLNAGAGVYSVQSCNCSEYSIDLFYAPLKGRKLSACANLEVLPFKDCSFSCVICVGEVLSYCDPASALSEFSRVLVPSGQLICDFGNSLSFRRWFTASYGRAAELVVDHYNGSTEPVWIYNPNYIISLMRSCGFIIKAQFGTHVWSSFARRAGASTINSLSFQNKLRWIPQPKRWADVITLVAELTTIEK